MKARIFLKSVGAGLVTAILLGASSAHALFLTTNTLDSPTLADFSQFVANPVQNALGPIQIGGLVAENIEYTGNPNTGLYAWNGSWGLVDNGRWDNGRNGYLGQNNARPGDMIITFLDGDVAGVGGFMNYCRSVVLCGDLIISAYDVNNVLLESYNVTNLADIVTPNGVNDGAFRGIHRAQADIHSFRIFGFVPVLDDLVFSRQGVPEPLTIGLLSLGLFGIGLARRRRPLT